MTSVNPSVKRDCAGEPVFTVMEPYTPADQPAPQQTDTKLEYSTEVQRSSSSNNSSSRSSNPSTSSSSNPSTSSSSSNPSTSSSTLFVAGDHEVLLPKSRPSNQCFRYLALVEAGTEGTAASSLQSSLPSSAAAATAAVEYCSDDGPSGYRGVGDSSDQQSTAPESDGYNQLHGLYGSSQQLHQQPQQQPHHQQQQTHQPQQQPSPPPQQLQQHHQQQPQHSQIYLPGNDSKHNVLSVHSESSASPSVGTAFGTCSRNSVSNISKGIVAADSYASVNDACYGTQLQSSSAQQQQCGSANYLQQCPTTVSAAAGDDSAAVHDNSSCAMDVSEGAEASTSAAAVAAGGRKRKKRLTAKGLSYIRGSSNMLRSYANTEPASEVEVDGKQGASPTKNKRCGLALEVKVDIIKRVSRGERQSDLADEYGVKRFTVKTILKKSKVYLQCWNEGAYTPKTQRLKGAKREDLEMVLCYWYNQAVETQSVTGSLLCAKAVEFARKLGYTDFKTSHGWLDRFKRRKGIVLGRAGAKKQDDDAAVAARTAGEGRDAVESTPLGDALLYHDPSNVFSMQETGLFYRAPPSSELCAGAHRCPGGVRAKDRFSVLMCTNMTATEKFPLVVAGSIAKSKYMHLVKDSPVQYVYNTDAWFTRDSILAWLLDLDDWFSQHRRKVMMILRSLPIHDLKKQQHQFQSITLYHMQPSAQLPLQTVVVSALKLNYRHSLLMEYIHARRQQLQQQQQPQQQKSSQSTIASEHQQHSDMSLIEAAAFPSISSSTSPSNTSPIHASSSRSSGGSGGSPPPKLPLSHMISALSRAWHAVTETEIIDGFQRAGICRYGSWSLTQDTFTARLRQELLDEYRALETSAYDAAAGGVAPALGGLTMAGYIHCDNSLQVCDELSSDDMIAKVLGGRDQQVLEDDLELEDEQEAEEAEAGSMDSSEAVELSLQTLSQFVSLQPGHAELLSVFNKFKEVLGRC